MTIKTTRWSPDTCGCSFDYEWDNAVAADVRTHTFTNVVKRCPEHGARSGVALYDAVLAENVTKNTVLGIANGIESAITEENYRWSYDGARVLQVEFVGVALNGGKRLAIQSAADIQFGPGKVAIL